MPDAQFTETSNVFTFAADTAVEVTPPAINGPEDVFTHGFLDGAGFLLSGVEDRYSGWNAVHGGGVRAAGSLNTVGSVDYYRTGVHIDGKTVLVIADSPAAIETLTLLAIAGRTSANRDLVHPDLDDLARDAGRLAGRAALLDFLAVSVEESDPQIAVEMRTAAREADSELRTVSGAIRTVVRNVAHVQALAYAENARARAAAAASQAALVLEDMLVSVPDPTMPAVVWPADVHGSIATANFTKAALDGYGLAVTTPAPLPRSVPSRVYEEERTSPWVRSGLGATLDLHPPRGNYRRDRTLTLTTGPAAELASLVSMADWVDVSDRTVQLLVRAGFVAGSQQRVRSALDGLAAIGETSESLTADLTLLEGLEMHGVLPPAREALAGDVARTVADVCAGLRDQAAAVTAALDAAPPLDGMVAVTAPGEVVGSWLAAGVPSRTITFRPVVTRAVPQTVDDTLARARRTFDTLASACTTAGLLNPPAGYVELITVMLAAIDSLPRTYDALALEGRDLLSSGDRAALAGAWDELDAAFTRTEETCRTWLEAASTPTQRAERTVQNAVGVFRRVTAAPTSRGM